MKTLRELAQETPSCFAQNHGKFGPTFGASESKKALLTRQRTRWVVDLCEEIPDRFAQLCTARNPIQNRIRDSVELGETPHQTLSLGGADQSFSAPEEVVDRRGRHVHCDLDVVDTQARFTIRLDDPDGFIKDFLMGGVAFHCYRP